MKRDKKIEVVSGKAYKEGFNTHSFERILGLASAEEATIIYPGELTGTKIKAPDKGIEGYYSLNLELVNGIPRNYCLVEEWA